MRTKVDIEELARQLDLEKAISRIKSLAETPRPKRTYGDLLQPLMPHLLEARERKVHFTVLLQCLREIGIVMSEPTLRQYLRRTAGKGSPSRTGVKSRKSAREKKPKPPPPSVAPRQSESDQNTETQRQRPPRMRQRDL